MDQNSKLKRYQKIEKLGEGGYGEVYSALDKQTNKKVAIKKIKFGQTGDGIPCSALREIALLKNLDHTNIVQLYDIIYLSAESKLYLIFEFIQYDLKKFLDMNYINQQKKGLNQYQIKTIMHQILKGVEYLHVNRVIHRDLKPANVLIQANGHIKIADLGLAKSIIIPIEALSPEIQTMWYRAPEVLLGKEDYSLGVDVWSVGLIMAELATGKVLCQGESEIGQIFKIFQIFGTPTLQNGQWENINELQYYKQSYPKFRGWSQNEWKKQFKVLGESGLDLMLQMLKLDPSKRITIKQALNHNYFEEIDAKQNSQNLFENQINFQNGKQNEEGEYF